jgi:hypothetical protein
VAVAVVAVQTIRQGALAELVAVVTHFQVVQALELLDLLILEAEAEALEVAEVALRRQEAMAALE